MGVSICVCLLVCLVLFINIFILINSSYSDVLQILENTENRELDLILNYVDIQLTIFKDFSNNGIQVTRNLLENLKRNEDFLNSVTILKKRKYVRPYMEGGYSDCSADYNKFGCVIFLNFNQNDSNDKLSTIVHFTFPFMKFIFDQRFIYINDRSLYNFLNFVYKEEQALFFYPYGKMDTQFEKDNLTSLLKNYTEVTKTAYLNLLNEEIPINIGNTNFNLNNLSLLFANSPLITPFSLTKYIYLDIASSKSFTTASILFNPQTNINNLNSLSNFRNVIFGEWSFNLIDELQHQTMLNYRGTVSIISFLKEFEPLMTDYSCLFMIKIYEMSKGYLNITNENFDHYRMYNISDCIREPDMKYLFNYYFSTKNITEIQYLKRKIRLPLINFDSSPGSLYKIFRMISPDIITKFVVGSDFFISIYTFIYVLRDESISTVLNDILSESFLSVIYLFLYCKFTVWFLNILLILYLLSTVTSKISTPINKLIDIVMNIGKEQSNSENSMEFDNICYPDDKDIDEFFQICKNLVKGGFSEESNKIQKAQFLFTAYNNISYIKINNIIIEEEDILKRGSNKANFMFYYCHKNEENISEMSKSKQTLDMDKKSNFNENSNGGIMFPPRKSVILDNDKILEKIDVEFKSINGNNMIIDPKIYRSNDTNMEYVQPNGRKSDNLVSEKRLFRVNSYLRIKETINLQEKLLKYNVDVEISRMVEEMYRDNIKKPYLSYTLRKHKFFDYD